MTPASTCTACRAVEALRSPWPEQLEVYLSRTNGSTSSASASPLPALPQLFANEIAPKLRLGVHVPPAKRDVRRVSQAVESPASAAPSRPRALLQRAFVLQHRQSVSDSRLNVAVPALGLCKARQHDGPLIDLPPPLGDRQPASAVNVHTVFVVRDEAEKPVHLFPVSRVSPASDPLGPSRPLMTSSSDALAGSASSATPSATSTSFVYLVYASVYSCGALFLIPGVVAVRRLVRTWRRDRTAVRLYGLLALGCSLRASAFLLVALWMLALFQSHAKGLLDRDAAHLHLSYLQLVFLWQVLGALASLVLASVFLLIFNTWAAMVDKVQGHSFGRKHHLPTDALLQSLHTRGAPDLDERRDSGAIAAAESSLKPPPPPRLLFIRLMMAVYLLQMGMFLFARQDPRSRIRRSLLLVATVLLVCCWAACVVLLPAYGERMCVLLDKVAEDVTHRKRNIRRIAFIAAVFCLMHTVSLLLLAASQCTPPSDEASSSVVGDGNATHPRDFNLPHIPLHAIVQANPAFFFPSGTAADGAAHTNDRLLRWVVMVEVLEFPIEWAMLMALLCVLPARSALPAFRGYRPIPDRSWQT